MEEKISLKNVRLSFPHLFEKHSFEGDKKKAKYRACFLLNKDKHSSEILIIKQIFSDLAKLKGQKVSNKNLCLQDGDSADKVVYDGNANHYILKTSNYKAITVLTGDGKKAEQEIDCPELQPGCYVNAVVSFYFFHKPPISTKILSNLWGVKYISEGEPFNSSENTDDTESVGALLGEEAPF